MVNEEMACVRALTERLFLALQRRDIEAAAACYHDTAVFSAPVIGVVEGRDVKTLWQAIFSNTSDSSLSFTITDIGVTSAKVEGVVAYSVTSSGRRVIHAFSTILQIRDQLVAFHEDTFDAWDWAKMAYGPAGLLFGWSRLWQLRQGENVRTK